MDAPHRSRISGRLTFILPRRNKRPFSPNLPFPDMVVVLEKLLPDGGMPSVFWLPALVLLLGLVGVSTNTAYAQESTTRIEFLKYGSMATHVDQSRDGAYIAVGLRNESGGDSEVVLWSTEEQQRVWSQSYSTSSAPRVAFDSTGSRLAVATNRGEITVWNLNGGTTSSPKKTGTSVTDLQFGPRGILGAGISLGMSNGTSKRGAVQVWSSQMNQPTASFRTDMRVRSLSFRPGTFEVAFAASDSKLTLWNYRFNTTKTINTPRFCSGKVVEVLLPRDSPDLYFVTESYAMGDLDYFCVLNSESKSLLRSYRREDVRHLESVSPGTVAFSRGNYVYTLDVQTGAESIVFESDNKVYDLSYKNGRLVVANSDVVVLDI